MIDFFEFVKTLKPVAPVVPTVDEHTAYLLVKIDGKSVEEVAAWMGFPVAEVSAAVERVTERERAFNARHIADVIGRSRG